MKGLTGKSGTMGFKETFPSTKFVMLDDTKAIKRNQVGSLLCVFILISLALACAVSAYIYYGVILRQNQTPPSSESPNNTSSVYFKNQWNFLNRKGAITHPLMCSESQNLSAIPLAAVENFQPVSTIFDFLNLNLLLYYQRVIDEADPKDLKMIFGRYENDLKLVNNSKGFLMFLKALKGVEIQYCVAFLQNTNVGVDLKHFQYFVTVTKELADWYAYLTDLRGVLLENKQKVGGYSVEITERNFEKFVNETKHKIGLYSVTDKKLQEVNEIVTGWTKPLKVRINGSSVVFYERVLLLSEVARRLQDIHTVEKVIIIASHTVYLDTDLILAGAHVAIVSPRWIFWKLVTINLSGRPGKEWEEETQGEGKPGNPGQHSGSFFGLGDINEKFLKVLTDGGRGGNGQNGAKGRDGINNTRPAPPVKTPSCVVQVSASKNSFHTVTRYKVFNDKGCGGRGFDGGTGGAGGRGGEAIIINKNPKIIKGSHGTTGTPGKGGEGGRGGHNGCFYEILDVDDEVLHPISLVKCMYNTLPSGSRGSDNHNSKGNVQPFYNNLSITYPLLQFFSLAGEDFLKVNDQKSVVFFLKLIQSSVIENRTDFRYILELYTIFERLNRIKFYEFLKKDVEKRLYSSNNCESLFLRYAKTLAMGKMLLLKPGINYLFIDFDNFLDILQENIRNKTYIASFVNEKVENKIKKLASNVKAIQSKLELLNGVYNDLVQQKLEAPDTSYKFYVSLASALQERRVLYMTLTTTNIFDCFLHNIFNENKTHNACTTNYESFITMEKQKEKYFGNCTNITPHQKRLLSNVVMTPEEYEKFEGILAKASNLISSSIDTRETFLEIWKSWESKEMVEKFKNAFDLLNEFDALSFESKSLLEALTDELDHLMTLYSFVEWRNLEKSFLEDWGSLRFREECEGLEVLEERLRGIGIGLEYKLAVDVVQQKFYPIRNFKKNLQILTDPEEALNKINQLRHIRYEDFVCKDIQEAVFDTTSSSGPFYTWQNSEIRDKLKSLFEGNPINLKAVLYNHHVLDKAFIKFKSIRLEFKCNQNSVLHGILKNFRIEMTHSGFSYYSWRGEIYVIVSDEVTMSYSLKMHDNGEPEVYNALFKKFKKIGPMLSPYTTWTIQLLPINSEADFGKLFEFTNSITIRLIGEGIFISQ